MKINSEFFLILTWERLDKTGKSGYNKTIERKCIEKHFSS